VSSVPRNAEIRSSSVLWMSWVPQMKRTDAIPYPWSLNAFRAASTSTSLSANPR
jgi:hypothetical protein